MFDLRDDGTIGIDFETTNEQGEVVSQTVVVKAPPSFGAYKRLRAEVESINKRYGELAEQLRNDPAVSVQQMQSQLQAALEDSAIEWWRFVLVGDETFKGLGPDTPPDSETWPVYLAANESIVAALTHWKSTPLARGGKLEAKTQ